MDKQLKGKLKKIINEALNTAPERINSIYVASNFFETLERIMQEYLQQHGYFYIVYFDVKDATVKIVGPELIKSIQEKPDLKINFNTIIANTTKIVDKILQLAPKSLKFLFKQADEFAFITDSKKDAIDYYNALLHNNLETYFIIKKYKTIPKVFFSDEVITSQKIKTGEIKEIPVIIE